MSPDGSLVENHQNGQISGKTGDFAYSLQREILEKFAAKAEVEEDEGTSEMIDKDLGKE